MADVDLWMTRASFVYRVEYGWPGMLSQTTHVDLGREVRAGMQVKVDSLWWRVERVEPPGLRERCLGRVTAAAAD
jgi:hypothetical protein